MPLCPQFELVAAMTFFPTRPFLVVLNLTGGPKEVVRQLVFPQPAPKSVDDCSNVKRAIGESSDRSRQIHDSGHFGVCVCQRTKLERSCSAERTKLPWSTTAERYLCEARQSAVSNSWTLTPDAGTV
jgi:hypothetical protein